MDAMGAPNAPPNDQNDHFIAKAQSAISTKLFLALGFITITAIVAGVASIVALNRFQDNYDMLINAELPTLEDTAHISQLSISVAGRGASLIISPTTWTRVNLIAQVEDDAAWLEEIVNSISTEALSGNRKQELLDLKEQLFSTYNTLNTLTENRIVYAERLSEIDLEMIQLQEDLVSVQFGTNLPDGTIAPSGPLHQWNESIHSVIFMLMTATRLEHSAPLIDLEKRATRKLDDVRGQYAYLPHEAKLDAQDTLERLDAITFGRTGLFHVKKLDLDTLNQIQASLSSARTIAEQFISASNLATQDIRAAITKTNRDTSRSMDITLQAMIGFILVSALVAIATFLYVSRTVLRRLVQLRVSMLAHAEGEYIKINTSGDDEITDMARSLQYLVDTLHSREAGLVEARDEAEKASVAKTRFLAAASHDLRQPLQALNLFVYALESKETEAEKRDIIKLIRNSLDSLKELLNTLLDISKLEASVVQPAFKDFGVGPMIARIKSELTAVAWANDLELRTVDSSAHIYSDPSLLETIVRNLVDNAIKYTERGRVLIGCRRRDGHLRIEIRDTGPGIANDKLELIFQDFYQIDNQARQRAQGLGLGLSIVRRMSDLLGCRIGCSSKPGKGSTFWIDVPLSSIQVDEEEAFFPTSMVHGDEHIVIIEDDEQVLLGLKSLLNNAGYSTQTFLSAHTNTIRGAFIGASRIPDLIIADYRLDAELTGRDAIDMIRKTLATDIPAIIITGDTAPERLREAKKSGFPILHKPVQPEELMSKVHKVLSRKSTPEPPPPSA
ncbi:ATP-binding protein [Magnetovibrio sp.]|uniref:ATP-binding protein n=1 Tax=Magnetovibrio sp. TaxID=2024836 RepID=UPI002F930BCB